MLAAVTAEGNGGARRSFRERVAAWRRELSEHGLAAAATARLYRHSGTAETRPIGRALTTHSTNQRLTSLEQVAAIGPLMAWIEQATLTSAPLISVITPTRNRARLLPRAIDSVLAQTYPKLELIVVDDGSTDETTEVIAAIADPRLRSLRVEHRGVGAARNAGLAEARGELIAYVDDDNAMHPTWLKSVAWGFEQRPEIDVLYGGMVIEDVHHTQPERPPALPRAVINPFDRAGIAEANPADISAIAHRAGLARGALRREICRRWPTGTCWRDCARAEIRWCCR